MFNLQMKRVRRKVERALTNDGNIDMADIAVAARHFGDRYQ